MKRSFVVEFDQQEYACLISAWTAVVSPETIEDFTFFEFLSRCAMAGAPVVLRIFREFTKNNET